MKIMRIGTSLINLDNYISISTKECDDGVKVIIEYPGVTKEYIIANEFDPKYVCLVLGYCLENSCKTFDFLDYLIECRKEYKYDT